MRHAQHLLLGAALLALWACGQPDPAADAGTEQDAGEQPVVDAGRDAGAVDAGVADAGFAPFQVSQWCENLALARCQKAERCLTVSAELRDACMERELANCPAAEYAAAVAQGRLQYLPQQAADCVNAYATVACTQTPAECEPVFQGLVAPDGGCLLAEECQAGAYCLTYSNACPSTCYAYRSVGEGCNWYDRQCDPSAGNCANVDGGTFCVAKKGVGEACVYFSDCRADLACVDKQCVKREAKLGEACREVQGYPYCEADTFCRQDPVPDGQTAPPGVCQRKAGLGGVCSGYGTCLTGLRCSSNYATGTCIPLGTVNDTCSNYNDCQQELFCSPPTSRCLQLPGPGGDCGSQGSFYRCRTGSYCDYADDTCHPRKGYGEPCTHDGMCASSACEYGLLTDGGMGNRCIDACLVRLDGGF